MWVLTLCGITKYTGQPVSMRAASTPEMTPQESSPQHPAVCTLTYTFPTRWSPRLSQTFISSTSPYFSSISVKTSWRRTRVEEHCTQPCPRSPPFCPRPAGTHLKELIIVLLHLHVAHSTCSQRHEAGEPCGLAALTLSCYSDCLEDARPELHATGAPTCLCLGVAEILNAHSLSPGYQNHSQL